jgi:hypothetical protein
LKNMTAVAEVKKRKGTGREEMISKKRKVEAAFAVASAGSAKEIEATEEEVGEMEASTASVDVDLMASAVQGLGGGLASSAPDSEPLPSVFGHASASSSS